jgi:hypothetical protein
LRYLKIFSIILIIAFVPIIDSSAQTYDYLGQAISPADFLATVIPGSEMTNPASLGIRFNSPSNVTDAFYMLVTGTTTGSFAVGSRRLYNTNDPTKSIAVQLRPSGSTSEIGSTNTTGAVVLTGNFIRNQYSNVSFNVVIPSITPSVPDGTYTNTFTFSAYTLSKASTLLPPNGILITSIAPGSFVITVNVVINASQADISFAPATLSFPTLLVTGSSASVSGSMITSIARPFSLSVTSVNRGVLKAPLPITDTIAYTFTFDGTLIPLVNVNVPLLTNQAAEFNKLRNLIFSIPEIPFVEGGTYTDSLTFTLITN